MAVPRSAGWQAQILRGLGEPVTPANVKFMNAWAQAEGGSAANNPFNTTQGGPGAIGNYNSVGVKNYASPQAGIRATIATLKNGRYGAILKAMGRGNSAMADAQAEATTPWGTGSLIEKVLGGPVSGGQLTNEPVRNLAHHMMSGQAVNAVQGQDPVSGLLAFIMQQNQAQQQLPQSRFIPF